MNLRLDHFVLTVRDIEVTAAFYGRALGMTRVTFNGRHALQAGSWKINLHQQGHEFEPKADLPTPGSADLCFVTDQPVDELIHYLEGIGIGIIEGPVSRTGVNAPLRSIYFRDPDGNLIEIANEIDSQTPTKNSLLI